MVHQVRPWSYLRGALDAPATKFRQRHPHIRPNSLPTDPLFPFGLPLPVHDVKGVFASSAKRGLRLVQREGAFERPSRSHTSCTLASTMARRAPPPRSGLPCRWRTIATDHFGDKRVGYISGVATRRNHSPFDNESPHI